VGHTINAVIGRPEAVMPFAAVAGCPPPTELPQGFVIVPLWEREFDRISGLKPGPYAEGFTYLSASLMLALNSASDIDPLVYLETNYSGGIGSQAAAAFVRGKIAFAEHHAVLRDPQRGDGPINRALKVLGVTAVAGQDEFDALDLRRFRTVEALGIEDWED